MSPPPLDEILWPPLVLDPFYIVKYYLNWVKTSWTYSISMASLFIFTRIREGNTQKICMFLHCVCVYRVFHILPQIYTANHATFPKQMYAITA